MNPYEEQLNVLTRGFDAKSADMIERSFRIAERAHEGQKRISGDPYITHSIEVAVILKEMKMGAVTICAGLLHDVIEDTAMTAESLKAEIGEEAAFLVESLSLVTAKVFKTEGQVFSESLKKMFLAMAKDIRVIIIKLADRLHNMRTISFLSEDRQKAIAQETLNVYAPLAHRLGMARVKWELEDIAFSVLNPKAYREIGNYVAEKRAEREKRITSIKEILEQELKKAAVDADITGRPKHFYSIFQKMARENKKFENIYDLIAMRIITGTNSACYTVLGVIHNRWKPLPGRFKDYIAMPKSNMYQSLHTTILDDSGQPVEIQIRTEEMDRLAEEGIAAHWNYKEDRSYDVKEDGAFMWLRQLLDWNSSIEKSDEFLKELKVDLFDEEVFVFTPKGEVKELIRGATVLDFAYSVHSNLGDSCIGAKVNGKWVTIKYELQNGDIVEILKGANQHPTNDWLKAAKTTKAKNRIRHWLRTNQNIKENVDKGKALLSKSFVKHDLVFEDVPEDIWNRMLEHYNVKKLDDVLAGIGYGEYSENRIATLVKKLLEEEKKSVAPQDTVKKIEKGEVIVEGKYADIAYKIARCCNPVPGDEITGIYTKKGVSIHRRNCASMSLNKITAPVVQVAWNSGVASYFMSRMILTAKNIDGMINDVLNTVTKNQAFISSVSSRAINESRLEADLTIKVQGQKHLQDVLSALNRVKGVISVKRAD